MIFSNLVDRVARRPSVILGYLLYRFPIGRRPGFDLVLDRLPPQADDRIVEIGCGGGVFMRRALISGCQGLAIDHSADMVANPARLNRQSVKSGRLQVQNDDASSLPASDDLFDKAYCLNAFFFFPDPQNSIKEMARVMKPGDQLALVTSPPEFEPQIVRFSKQMARSMRFYTQETLAGWMQSACFTVEDMSSAPNAGNLVIGRKGSPE